MDSMDSCHSFNLNDQPLAESRIEEPDPNHLKQRILNDQHQLSTSLEEGVNLVEAMTRIERENKKIMKSLAELFEKYNDMHHKLTDLIKNTSKSRAYDDDDHYSDDHGSLSKKRKVVHLSNDDDNYNKDYEHRVISSVHSCISDEACCTRARLINYKPKISTVFVHVDQSDTSLAVKDGYQWRKYGQKVTRDNPSPRAYFKCSFAPICPVKKKVQRSVDDTTVLVVTYEGEHNHKKPAGGATLSHLSSEVLMESEDEMAAKMLQPRLVDEMASSLTKDTGFTSALAAAIYSKVLQEKIPF